MLDKTYDPKAIEPRAGAVWEKQGAFKAGAGARPGAAPFSVMMPPPNITGSLHMGHALNATIQDILVRFERMRGKNVLWQPGMDHAGIATQMVVERRLAAGKGPSRRDMGREKFIDHIWQWREESGGIIAGQLRRLGASCDWSRERFTMDKGLSQAVMTVFVTLYKQGLIYKDKRLVNWDPQLLTAISDLEVEQREVQGNLWHMRYALEGKVFNAEDPASFITIATTRPETMPGDVAIAVNPADKRYRHLVGSHAVLPFVGRKLPIIADNYADMTTGSGAVKITPAHDFNDFELGRRHNLRLIRVLDESAHINLSGNEDFWQDLEVNAALQEFAAVLDGQERFAARRQLVALLEEAGYLAKTEPHKHMVPHGDRSAVPVEPMLTNQWYVNAAHLARPAIAAVRCGKVKFVPQNWDKTYYNWLENIEPWCISRQLWWGHQIPAWYAEDGTIFVEKTEAEALAAAKAHFGKTVPLRRDEDVLDTWFSSALWPFATLGWPEKTPELAQYYPTSVLVTGFDIIFFWVARMMMAGLHFMDNVPPFHTVYVHALVRDKYGAKMSKSRGNIIDPLELIEEFGADALRFTLAIQAAQGRDVKLDPARIAGYRNFGTKLWNATRFGQMNFMQYAADFSPEAVKSTVNRWILTELAQTQAAISEHIEKFRFNEAAASLYRFVWHSFCDWYLELSKPVLQDENQPDLVETRACLQYCLEQIYKMLHPFMPFITEELWEKTALAGQKRQQCLALTSWPQIDFIDEKAAADINWLIDIVSLVRSVRAEMRVPAAKLAPLVILGADKAVQERLKRHEAALKRLARVETLSFADKAPSSAAQAVLSGVVYCLPLGSLIDIEAEKARLTKDLAKIRDNIDKTKYRLDNKQFIAHARPEIIAAERERLAEYQESCAKTKQALARLGGA
ncbi:MAG: valine--tRNA ligase [Candidatus Tokpelaia sp.]|nr:MAG: valine--tRNA ligase [Candidatus Tokpelaia sp.]KAA6207126.1 MAG: valine--tRNA ligase [Candidatus Tokpelaia sp.]